MLTKEEKDKINVILHNAIQDVLEVMGKTPMDGDEVYETSKIFATRLCMTMGEEDQINMIIRRWPNKKGSTNGKET